MVNQNEASSHEQGRLVGARASSVSERLVLDGIDRLLNPLSTEPSMLTVHLGLLIVDRDLPLHPAAELGVSFETVLQLLEFVTELADSSIIVSLDQASPGGKFLAVINGLFEDTLAVEGGINGAVLAKHDELFLNREDVHGLSVSKDNGTGQLTDSEYSLRVDGLDLRNLLLEVEIGSGSDLVGSDLGLLLDALLLLISGLSGNKLERLKVKVLVLNEGSEDGHFHHNGSGLSEQIGKRREHSKKYL